MLRVFHISLDSVLFSNGLYLLLELVIHFFVFNVKAQTCNTHWCSLIQSLFHAFPYFVQNLHLFVS